LTTEPRYDVFISYAHANDEHARQLDAWLRAQGLRTFRDRTALKTGMPWVRAIEDAIASSRAVAVLCGPQGLGNTQQYERELALVRHIDATSRGASFPVIPVVLPGNNDPPAGFLQLLTWVDLRDAPRVDADPTLLAPLVAAIRGEEVDSAKVRGTYCPYRGLETFREEDAPFFFGRSRTVETLYERVQSFGFVPVVGRSGSGKSSVVFAGLIPRLRKQALQPGGRVWDVVTLTPGAQPLHALARTFNPPDPGKLLAQRMKDLDKEAEALRSGADTILGDMIAEHLKTAEGNPDRLLLYVDQWEELYAQAPTDEVERKAHAADVERFVALLLAAAKREQVKVVMTMRADFYDRLMAHRALSRPLLAQQINIEALEPDELRACIVKPAELVKLTFSPARLVDDILKDTGTDEAMLPLLQHALKQCWERRKGTTITADDYVEIGGVAGAIATTADGVFAACKAEGAREADIRRLFLGLVATGERQEDTRARIPMPADESLRKIVKRFADPKARLLVTGAENAGGAQSTSHATVEVAHEALIRSWRPLQDWVKDSRPKLEIRRAIMAQQAEWRKNPRADMLVPRGLQLQRARRLLNDHGDVPVDDIRDFITKSARRANRRYTLPAWGLASVAILGAVLHLMVPDIDVITGERLAVGSVFRDRTEFRLPCPQCPEMVVVRPGSFMMGSETGLKAEKPVHRVTIARPLAVGRTEVTFAEWDACVTARACTYKQSDNDGKRGNQPVINVSWNDLQNYLAWLKSLTGKEYRLLSEAEWEYAARAGSTTEVKAGKDGNTRGSGSEWSGKRTAPVGSFKANGFGLYDMLGNVSEWTEDCWNENYEGAPEDGRAWTTGDCSLRVLRGGSWFDRPELARSASRDSYDTTPRHFSVGFRVARTL